MAKFFGKYRGTVVDNRDPVGLGRVRAKVPAVSGDGVASWAMPCVPYAGDGVGFFMLPPVGAGIWVEFEGGDVDSPIWSGCFWGADEVPASAAMPGSKTIRTTTASLRMGEEPGELVLEARPAVCGAVSVTLGPAGIRLVAGPSGVLEVTAAGIKVNGRELK